jgi:TolB-like protein/DNA-binding winged helix-turn-helix (wHTH) protein
MDGPAAEQIFLFDGFRLDPRAGGLFRVDQNGVLARVAIGSRALDLLTLLVRRHGDLVSKDEIMTAVWPEMVVEDSNLPIQISALRRVLDEGRADGSLIQTIPGRGYRFVAPTTCCEAEPSPTRHPTGGDGNRAADQLAPAPTTPKAAGLRMRDRWRSDLLVSSMRVAVSRRRRIASIAITAAGAVLVIAVSAWWLWPTAKPSPTTRVRAATSISQPLVAPRLSIVVLPFVNLSGDGEQQYFADGITDNVTTDLSRLADMFVISRNTAFTYKGKRVHTKQVGRELGVRYVLEGSVSRAGNQARVNAQLIDAETESHLWAERFAADTSDVFALQDEITSRLANALGVELIASEAARPSAHSDALDYILRGRATRLKPNSRDVLAEATALYERALSLDPGSVEAQSLLATTLVGRVLDFGSSSEDADIMRAEELAAKAVAASPSNALAHYAKAVVLRVRRRCAEAIPEYETALSLDRNLAAALAAIGRCKINNGPIDEGIAAQEQAIRLSPRDPLLWSWYFRIGEGHLLLLHVDDAILWLEKARNANPAPGYIHAYLAAAYAFKGETDRAAAELADARRLGGEGSYSSVARLRANTRYESQTVRALCEATFYAGLRKAGMLEK